MLGEAMMVATVVATVTIHKAQAIGLTLPMDARTDETERKTMG
jgi:hypothetical protein